MDYDRHQLKIAIAALLLMVIALWLQWRGIVSEKQLTAELRRQNECLEELDFKISWHNDHPQDHIKVAKLITKKKAPIKK